MQGLAATRRGHPVDKCRFDVLPLIPSIYYPLQIRRGLAPACRSATSGNNTRNITADVHQCQNYRRMERSSINASNERELGGRALSYY